jgi:hypothetical protein
MRANRYLWGLAGFMALTGCGRSSEPPKENLLGALPSLADVRPFAVCGTSVGMAYYQEPKDEGHWEDDRITSERYAFVRDGKGQLHVLYSKASGRWVDEADDGGKVLEVRRDDQRREVEAMVSYPGSGVMETYSVHGLPDGSRWMLWTTNKTRVGGIITKAAAYRARCA